MKSLAVLILLAGTITNVLSDDQLGFVFELVRHGARAPLRSSDPWIFQVPVGYLTHSGMRQKLLLGKYNRLRYIDQLQFIDETYNPNQIFVESTDVHRTLQSAYSELMGLYPQVQSTITQGERESLSSGKGMPKIKIRNPKDLNKALYNKEDLGSTIDGYTLIPVYNYINTNNDDFESCPKADDESSYNYNKNAEKIFADVSSYIVPSIRKALGKSQNMTDDEISKLDFKGCYRIQDKIKGYTFEGYPHSYFLSTEQCSLSRNTQKWVLTLPLGDDGRQLSMTKLMLKPLKYMQDRVDSLIKNSGDTKDNKNDLKYVINSAHDDQISNMLLWLNPHNYDFIDVPYSSNIYFELFYDSDCITSKKDETCFSVHVLHEGKPLSFDTCLDGNNQRGSKSLTCSYSDFKAHIEKIKFQGDILQKCQEQYIPPTAA
ncbi:histidine acid phosphatase family protein [Stylonychia lemnae]|uniref:Histidine acid phosphatase family protein n=1 Tax=Stylonychia lemnae TaxID=5949 RepID=A0A078AGJ4_STYLE|nr:histidine acid phosphatase family protein [Stylonychia lemnae]|eukprot:CDW80941.1 histidine acid phosphatase family protein [Stylonychia lemnae]